MKLVFVGTLADQPMRVLVPDTWSGRVSVIFDVHRGQPSRRYRLVKEEMVDPTAERPPS